MANRFDLWIHPHCKACGGSIVAMIAARRDGNVDFCFACLTCHILWESGQLMCFTKPESWDIATPVTPTPVTRTPLVEPAIRTDHPYGEHHTYTGPGCATCGLAKAYHAR